MKTRERGVQYGDGGEQANPISSNSWEFGAHPMVGTVSVSYTHLTLPTKRIV